MIEGKKATIFGVIMLLAAVVLLGAYMYVVSPRAIRGPKLEHAHVRLQIIVDSQDVNFGDAQYQTPKGVVCTDELSSQPIHFHDNKNQFLHLHWKDITGGLVLKNYGWNFIGGPDDVLGYRADQIPLFNKVPIFGDVLPTLPSDATLWVYTGDATHSTLRSTDDFLSQTMEEFLGTKSSVGVKANPGLLTSLLFAKASAHDGAHSDQELTELNNLLGNVVIFAQKGRPTDDQVKDRFAHLEPLAESTCGG